MAARLSEAAQTQYENLEYCNGRLCAVAAVGRAGVKADTHESAGAAPAGTPIGSGARRRCRRVGFRAGRAEALRGLGWSRKRGLETHLDVGLAWPPSTWRWPNLQVLSTDLRLQ